MKQLRVTVLYDNSVELRTFNENTHPVLHLRAEGHFFKITAVHISLEYIKVM
jgi:hypothetical protein